MTPASKFFYALLPSVTMFLLFGIGIYFDENGSLDGCQTAILISIILLIVNLILYRRQVARNERLGPGRRESMMKAVTIYGPFGQIAYYIVHIHPYGPDSPPTPPTDYTPTMGDEFMGI